jgi:hypothetical protein
MEKAINILVDISYDLCVMWLMDLAHYTGLSYREVNFVVFMIVLPLVILFMFLVIMIQHVMLRKYIALWKDC